MTGTYSRFEVRYRVAAAPALAHVWGWADDRKGVERLLKGLAVNAQLQHVQTIDRHAQAVSALARMMRAQPIELPNQARPGLLL